MAPRSAVASAARSATDRRRRPARAVTRGRRSAAANRVRSLSVPQMPSFDVLRAYLEARASFTEDEFAFMREQFIPNTLPAGEFLQRAGDVARYAAFVATGCLRSYVIDANGKEHIIQFAPETWWLADSASLLTGKPSQ